jgi:hypothetical protein
MRGRRRGRGERSRRRRRRKRRRERRASRELPRQKTTAQPASADDQQANRFVIGPSFSTPILSHPGKGLCFISCTPIEV